LFIYLSGQSDEAASPDTKADVIIVLGAGVFQNGGPSEGQVRRTKHGADLYFSGHAPLILCTGGYDTPKHVKTEAEVCSELLLNYGVPTSAILMEQISQSTEENAIEARKVMDAHQLKTSILVTDNFHVLRSRMLFGVYNVPVIVSPAQATTAPLGFGTALYSSWREVAGFGWYAVKSLLHLPITDTPL
jgi:uncharacterized SAM-binding protein YcdF (DUF218 family)